MNLLVVLLLQLQLRVCLRQAEEHLGKRAALEDSKQQGNQRGDPGGGQVRVERSLRNETLRVGQVLAVALHLAGPRLDVIHTQRGNDA